MPVVALAFRGQGDRASFLSLATDPFYGMQATAALGRRPHDTAARDDLPGQRAPCRPRERVAVLEWTDRGADGIFNTFYRTIPEIEPCAAWARQVAMGYYDYNSDDGRGWYNDLTRAGRVDSRGAARPCGLLLTRLVRPSRFLLLRPADRSTRRHLDGLRQRGSGPQADPHEQVRNASQDPLCQRTRVPRRALLCRLHEHDGEQSVGTPGAARTTASTSIRNKPGSSGRDGRARAAADCNWTSRSPRSASGSPITSGAAA